MNEANLKTEDEAWETWCPFFQHVEAMKGAYNPEHVQFTACGASLRPSCIASECTSGFG